MAMVGAMSRITQDVPPYMTTEGNPPKVFGPNTIGLRRRGVSDESRTAIKRAYRLLYRSGLNATQAIAEMETMAEIPQVKHLMDFVRTNTRGLVGRTAKSDSGAGASGSSDASGSSKEEAEA